MKTQEYDVVQVPGTCPHLELIRIVFNISHVLSGARDQDKASSGQAIALDAS